MGVSLWDKYILSQKSEVVITRCCRDMGYVAFTRFCCKLSFIANLHFFGFFCPDFYHDIEDFTQIGG